MFLSGGCRVQHHTPRDSWVISSTHVLYRCIDLGPNCRGPWTGSNPSWPWPDRWTSGAPCHRQLPRDKSLCGNPDFQWGSCSWSYRWKPMSVLFLIGLWGLSLYCLHQICGPYFNDGQYYPPKCLSWNLRVIPGWFLLPLLHPIGTWVLLISLPKYFLYLSVVLYLLF